MRKGKNLIMAMALILVSFLSAIKTVSAELISYSNVPFKSVDYFISTQSSFHFKSVILGKRLYDIDAAVESVEILLEEESIPYTTLNLINVQDENIGWRHAEKVIVVTRCKNDFVLWKEFLNEIKKKQDLERQNWLKPIRVMPPKIN